MVSQAKCTSCGAALTFVQGSRTSVCSYCQTTNIVENAIALGKIELDVTEDIKKLRANLVKFVEQNSIDEILRVSQKLLDWIPKDFVASYFFGYAKQQQNQPRFLYDFYQHPPGGTLEEHQMVAHHINSKSDLRDRYRIISFLEQIDHTFIPEYERVYKEKELKEEQYANVPRDVFICFSSFNSEIAERVLNELENDGNRCWISTRNLRPDDSVNYWKNIEDAIKLSSVFLVIGSVDSMRSKDVQREIELAQKYNKRLLEFKIDDTPHNTVFKYAFDGIKWIRGSSNLQQSYTVLLQRVFEELKTSKTSGTTKALKTSKTNVSLLPRFKMKSGSYPKLLAAVIAVISAAAFIWLRPIPPTIILLGEPVMSISYTEDYIEQGALAFDHRNNPLDVDIIGEVTGDVTGTYEIIYRAVNSRGNQNQIIRVINVIDDVPPVINLNGSSLTRIEAGIGSYRELGAVVIDEYHGRLDYTVEGEVNTSVVGRYELTYTAIDPSGNESSAVRTVEVVDTTPPMITLFGETEIVLTLGQSYEELGGQAIDLMDGEVELIIQSDLDVNQVGSYEILYIALDQFNNQSIRSRIVRIIPDVVCTECQGFLNLQVYQVDRLPGVWQFVNGLYVPTSKEEFDQLGRIGRILAEGSMRLADATIQNQSILSFFNQANNLLSWVNTPTTSVFFERAYNIELPSSDYALLLSGYFVPKETGTYTFTLSSDDAADLIIDNEVVIGHYGAQGLLAIGTLRGSIDLEAYVAYPFQVRIQDAGAGMGGLGVYWQKPNSRINTSWFIDSSELYSKHPYIN
jgi:LSD1 subclass zinc finger protein